MALSGFFVLIVLFLRVFTDIWVSETWCIDGPYVKCRNPDCEKDKWKFLMFCLHRRNRYMKSHLEVAKTKVVERCCNYNNASWWFCVYSGNRFILVSRLLDVEPGYLMGWVTACGQLNRLATRRLSRDPCQLNLAIVVRRNEYYTGER